MRFTDTQELFDDACEYPADMATLTEHLGDVEIEAPTGETTTLSTVFDRGTARTFQTPGEAYTSMLSNLDESFIGRKYYDDRGDNQPHPNSSWH